MNEITKRDIYLLPLIKEALDMLEGARYITKLDIKGPYYYIRINEVDKWIRTFSTKLGTYKCLVMPFGLCNAPAAFQQWIHEVFIE